MGYLGVDVDNAAVLVADVRADALTVDHARSLVSEGALLADFAMPCLSELDGIGSDLIDVANRIQWAMTTIMEFQLRLRDLTTWSAIPQPVRTPVAEVAPSLSSPSTAEGVPPRVAQWNGSADSPLNDVQQIASHNSYAVPGGVDVLYERGVRTFEIDIHTNPPPLAPLQGNGGSSTPAWHVYHVLGWSHREYEDLSQGLASLAALGSSDPVTVFIDNKDDFGSDHTAAAFDQLLRDELGERLFTPADLLMGSPGAASLLEATQRDGWPTIEQLNGRIIVVLTDRVQGYGGANQLAFVAKPPQFTHVAGQTIHEPERGVVFYNADAGAISLTEIEAVHASGTMLRTYFNPLCSERVLGQDLIEANYRAVDVTPDGSGCEQRVIVPPTPAPGPG